MSALADVFVQARIDTKSFGPDIKKGMSSSSVSSSAKTAGATAGKGFGSSFSSSFKSIGKDAFKFGAGLAGFAALTKGISGVISEGREAQKATALTEAAIKSTGGAANVSAAQMDVLSAALSRKVGQDDEVIQSGANLLLTFTNIRNEVGKGNDIFNQATATALDMSAALGTDMKGSVIQLGKALNDPIKGITALTRVGVAFTDQQKDQIKTLVESGDILGAQKIILAELSKEFGGAAESQKTAAMSAQVAWANLQEELGTRVLPVLDEVLTWFSTDGVAALTAFGGVLNDTVLPPLGLVADGLTGLVDGFNSVTAPIVGTSGALKIGAALLGGFVAIKLGTALISGFETLQIKAMYAGDSIGNAATRMKALQTAAKVAAGAAGLLLLADSANHLGTVLGATENIAGAAALGFSMGGPWGAAIGGGVGILKSFGDANKAASNAVEALTGTLDKNTGSITEQSRALVGQTLIDDDLVDNINKFGLSSKDVIDAILGIGDAGARVEGILAPYSDSVAGVTAASGDLSAEQRNAKAAAVELLNAIGGGNSDLELARSNFEFLAEGVGTTGGKFTAFGEQARNGATQLDYFGNATATSTGALKGHKAALDADKGAIEGVRSAIVGLIDKQYGLAAAIMDARKAAKSTANGFDEYTQAGQKNWAQIKAIVTATDGFSAATENGRRHIQQARDAIVAYADAQGKTTGQAEALADRLLGVADAADEVGRKHPNVKVTADTSQSLSKIQEVARYLKGLDDEQVKVYTTFINSGGGYRGTESYTSGAHGLFRPMAFGDFHPSQMGKSGVPILWNESGKGESYISHDPADRTRSLDIWAKTGKILGAMSMADGDIFHTGGLGKQGNGALQELVRTLNGLGKKDDRRDKILGRIETISDRMRSEVKDNLSGARGHLRDLLSSQRDLAQSISAGFDTTTYGADAPATAQGLFQRARAEVNDAAVFKHVLNQLRAKGANPSLLRALASAGPGALVQAQALAGLSRRQLNRYQHLLGAGDRAQDTIGNIVGNEVFGDNVKDARKDVRRLTDRLEDLNGRLKHLPRDVGNEVSKSLDHASVRLDGRLVGEVLAGRQDRRNRGG